MALIGTVAIVEGTGAPITTSAKTSTAGSLIVGGATDWHGTVAQTPNITSSLAGTYTKASDKTMNVGAERVMYGLTYNIGGTRGATHTLSLASTPSTGAAKALSWQEFDSIAAVPTVTVGTEGAGTSTAPSCSVTVPSGTATVVAIMTYGGSSTTFTVADGTQISEADEDSSNQSQGVAAKFGVSGTVTITWTLAASRQWACYAVAFQDTGGGVAFMPSEPRVIGQAVNRAGTY